MRHRSAVAALAAALALGLSLADPGSPAAAQAAPSRTWLALGDSYSSGTGIDAVLLPGPGARDCRRADGSTDGADGAPARAWAVSAWETIREEHGVERVDLVACSGARTDGAFVGWDDRADPVPPRNQFEEASYRESDGRWDVVSFTFGGNNIGFAEVLAGCVDSEGDWLQFDRAPGCDVDEATLRSRVDVLTGVSRTVPPGYSGVVTMPALFRQVVEHVEEGGDVVVVGYPRLVDPPAFYNRSICTLLRHHDYTMLNRVTGHLNERLAAAVAAAGEEHARRRVTFHYVDAVALFAGHGACAPEPWLNGLAFRPAPSIVPDHVSSYHPNQRGHDAVGGAVAALFGTEIRFDDPPAAARRDWSNETIAVQCDGAAGPDFEVSLRDGVGRYEPGGVQHFDVSLRELTEDDLTGDGMPETALLIECTPNPSNYVVQEIVVYAADGGLIGNLPEGEGLSSPDHLVPGTLSIDDGQLRAEARMRAEGQCRACGDPALAVSFSWRWDGSRLIESG